jgi:hypothetical protein
MHLEFLIGKNLKLIYSPKKKLMISSRVEIKGVYYVAHRTN